ncbi:MAG TPA: DUF1080 domain-containing protein [Candidatus Hydrogenedentes bacterium]|nr:DUF1080 domain-containing protein [Candidatus Hydrogenedentota bacterium]
MMRFILVILSLALSLPVWAAEAGQSVTLFNGKDFTGWKLFLPDAKADPAKTWSVKDGVVLCTGNPAGYMRTETPYENYRLRVEWRWPKDGGNSGVLLHIQEGDAVWPKSIEAQLHSGDAGDFWVIGGTEFKEHAEQGSKRVEGRRTLKLGASSEKPLGEWNQYEITCKGNSITVKVNGVAQNLASDCTVTKGFIGLQSEGAPVEFRNIILEPLK